MESSTIDVEENGRPSKIRKILDPQDADALLPSCYQNLEKESTEEKINNEIDNEIVNDQNAILSRPLEREEDQTTNIQLSKNQLKKLKRREKWEETRELRRIKRREKHKEKQARKAQQRLVTATLLQHNQEGRGIDSDSSSLSNNDDIDSTTLENQDEGVKKRKRSFIKPKQMPIGIILDTDFNELMTEKEIISLGSQLTRCYSLNKSAPYRVHLMVSSWGGTLKSRFENVLASTHLHWIGVKFLENDDFISAAKILHDIMIRGGGSLCNALTPTNLIKDPNHSLPTIDEPSKSGEAVESNNHSYTADHVSGSKTNEKISMDTNLENSEIPSPKTDEKSPTSAEQNQTKSSNPEPLAHQQMSPISTTPSIVYLTSDSPNTLSSLVPNTSYIVGGIVDKNRHKGICYKRACERGIQTAKLPIGEYMKMQSRTVLAVNHVVEIMLKWLETNDWGEAFLKVIPKRKQAILKTCDDIQSKRL
ncbi:putative trna m g methyltransferase domain-containing protein [Erysiphe necator]|uniref:tRNA (guanine(9)-N1)-methyltransferase n=1 Tax=Uncinula necator TaxID=52586 RepID=A0A0B1P4H0_UNCNE|nr:putative trna m g methyltransferase domain-containing protein [Erysiphe necator]